MKSVKVLVIGWIAVMAFIALPVFALAGETGEKAEMKTETGQTQAQGAQGPLRATEMMGKTVQDQTGNKVGEIGDLVIGDDGRIAYIVLSQGGVLGIGEKMVPVPWEKAASQTEDTVTLALDEKTLKEAPTFSSNEWQKFTQQDWEQTVRGYYGVESGQMEQPGMSPTKEKKEMQQQKSY